MSEQQYFYRDKYMQILLVGKIPAADFAKLKRAMEFHMQAIGECMVAETPPATENRDDVTEHSQQG